MYLREIVKNLKPEFATSSRFLSQWQYGKGYQWRIFKVQKKKYNTNKDLSKMTSRLSTYSTKATICQRSFIKKSHEPFLPPITSQITHLNLLVKVKVTILIEQQCSLIYHIKCRNCHHDHMGVALAYAWVCAGPGYPIGNLGTCLGPPPKRGPPNCQNKN